MGNKNVLIVGGGGREHAVGIALSESEDINQLYFAPGNAGTEQLPKSQNVPIQATAVDELVNFAVHNEVRLVFIGEEQPLALGLPDQLREWDVSVFGPNSAAAHLEISKLYARNFMRDFHIPHPYTVGFGSRQESLEAIQKYEPRDIVVKADGLASGKGVFLPQSYSEAAAAINTLFDLDHKVLIQERIRGSEVSAFIVTDGKRFTMLPFSQDHKRLKDGDRGPNTGGMGAYAPVPRSILTLEQERKIQDLAERTIHGLDERNLPYRGVIYMGIVLDQDKDNEPTVLEYNARFGDPEAQVVFSLLSHHGVDIYRLLATAAEGNLADEHIPSNLGSVALTHCLAAPGYPNKTKTGQVIKGLDQDFGRVTIHHGATKKVNGRTIVTGGRVLYPTAVARSYDEAAIKSYWASSKIDFKGKQYREDIGYQARILV